MDFIKIEGVSICGIAACVPGKILNNLECGLELFGSDLEGAIKVTGVKERRVCDEGSATSLDLCVKAAKTLQSAGDYDYSSFGGLVFVTQTPDLLLPNNATYAHALLGLPQNTPAFDINLACSGYPYGLWIAGMMARASDKPIVLLDGDTHSHFVSPYDRATALLFGDAGTATVLEPNGMASPWYFDFVTDGNLRDVLTICDGGYRNRVNRESADYVEQVDGVVRRAIDMKMDGMAVFNAVVRHAPNSLRRVMEAAANSAADYDFLLLHQANLMMIRQVAKTLGFAKEKLPVSLDKYGNVSSASIPLTMCSVLRHSISAQQNTVLMSAFGAGFTLGPASQMMGPRICPAREIL